jgi:hypothetical protein
MTQEFDFAMGKKLTAVNITKVVFFITDAPAK